MAREDVNIRVSANVAEAVRLWKAMEEGPKGMAAELDALGAKGKKSVGGLNSEAEKLIGNWASIGAGIAAATKLLEAYLAAQREIKDLEADSVRTADKATRQLANLAPSEALSTIRNDTFGLAVRRKVQIGTATDAAASLLGAGYGYGDVMKPGGAADAALKTLAATNASGKNVDAKQMIDAMTGFMDATGQEKSGANLAAAGKAAQAMFASNKLEIADLQALAPKAKSIFSDTGLKNEQIAILSMFKDVTTADIGSTSFKTGISRLVGAGNVPARTRALKELGLNPADVDFQGESFTDVQQRMSAGFLRAGDQAPRLKNQIFGDEGKLAADVLFTPAGVSLYQQRLAESRNSAGFNRAVSITEGGLEAQQNRSDSERVQAFFKNDYTDSAIARERLGTAIQNAGGGAGYRAIGMAAYDVAEGLGYDADTAARTGVRWVGGNQDMARGVVQGAKPEPVPVDVRVTIVDQNQVSVPATSRVMDNGKNRAPRQ